ncbi:GGDEF domain-containing protein [Dactylosporangium vinaceum]|uniref:GGDEF domain-containing protein n=1 Tax=Dactylosporangium vinaceum TaxID=53362 RepID=A0ABV5MFP2_9ACTN|nr:GGDEF domain-containing protein [Dactylosporangium vinaceum]UAB98821.1 GGDEF domain-containing protein [Dactylosporangium vinaceum]
MDPLAFLAGSAAAAGVCATLPLYLRARRAERLAARLGAQLEVAQHAASHDPLTGLPNRRAFYQRGADLVADRALHPLVAVVLDVDGFKQINDVFGHSAGDEVLVTTARRLAAYADDPGTQRGLVARLGGDEFAGLLAVRQGSPQEQADRLAEVLAAPMRLAGQVVTVSVSVGLVPVEPGAHLADAVHRADAAMYRTKGARNRPHPAAQHLTILPQPHLVHAGLRIGRSSRPSDSRPSKAT